MSDVNFEYPEDSNNKNYAIDDEPEKVESLGKVQMKLENGSTIICNVKISWTECIKFWLASFIAVALLWIVAMTLFAGMFGAMYRGY